MKKILSLIAASVMLFACANDKTETGGGGNPDSSEFDVSFNVMAPLSGKKTYESNDSRAFNPEAIGAEATVNTLYIYVFGPNGATTGTTDDYVLEGIYPFNSTTLVNDGDNQAVTTISVKGKTMKHFWFVANFKTESETVNITTESDMVNYLQGAIDGTDVPYIVLDHHFEPNAFPGMYMSAFKAIDFTTALPASPVSIPLVRAVARFDIENTISDHFTVESVQFYTRNDGYLFPSDAGGATVYGQTLPVARATDGMAGVMQLYGVIDIAGTVDQTKLMPAVGYLYEAAAADLAYVSIKGTYNGVTKILEVPFKYNGAAIDITRNYVYTYKLVDNNTMIGGIFTVLDWTSGETILLEDTTPFSIAPVALAPQGAAGPASFDLVAMTVDPGSSGTYILSFDSKGVPLSYFPNNAATWATVNSFTKNNTTGYYDLNVTIDPYASTTDDRIFTFTVLGNPPTSPGMNYQIVQKAALPPMPESNSYILNPPAAGTTVYEIGVSRVDTYWGDAAYGNNAANTLGGSTPWTVDVKWMDASGMVTRTADGADIWFSKSTGTGASDKFAITVPSTAKNGNFMVYIYKTADGAKTPLWSWHMWVTSYDPSAALTTLTPAAGTYVYPVTNGDVHRYAGTLWAAGGIYENCFMMDRNLGQIDVYPANTQNVLTNRGVLHYQWGRKDPFPTNIPLWDLDGPATYSSTANNIPGGAGVTMASSVTHPFNFYGVTGNDWLGESFNKASPWPLWNDAKKTYTSAEMVVAVEKSLYDPCPMGWVLPTINAFTDFQKRVTVCNSTRPALAWNYNGFRGLRYWPSPTGTANNADPVNGQIFFTPTTYRGSAIETPGSLEDWPELGRYYSSTISDAQCGYYMSFMEDDPAYFNPYYDISPKQTAMAVRCVKMPQ